MVKVKVQWGKEKYDNVELDTTKDLSDFRAVLYSLTNVPNAKQKILYKGSVLKDGANLADLKVPEVPF
jgi:ubiquitin carboxyl-terminal hydrolase 14